MDREARSLDATTNTPMADIKESNTPGHQPNTMPVITEDTTSIGKNLKRHKEHILNSLDSSKLYELYFKYRLDEENQTLPRRTKAEMLLTKIQDSGNYLELLERLEEDKEHMGHEYIASLLRGEGYGGAEEVKLSGTLCRRIMEKNIKEAIPALDVITLLPFLLENKLVTRCEKEELEIHKTKEKRAQELLTILGTKGPTAHYIFVYKCLANEFYHEELYKLLTNGHATETPQQTAVTKRHPRKLEPPEAITNEFYLQDMRKIRHYQQMGGEKLDEAEKLCLNMAESQETPLEAQIAFLLESCVTCMLKNNFELVQDRTEQAKVMCETLGNNDACLKARCSWILAWLHRRKGNYDIAIGYINNGLALIYLYVGTCEEAILLKYCHGCILDKTEKQKAIEAFKFSLDFNRASRDYGFIIQSHGMIRQAQLHLGVSPDDPIKNGGHVTKYDIQQAKGLLKYVRKEKIKPRTECMLLYTLSDVCRLEGNIQEAIEHVHLALELANDFPYITECAQRRQTLLYKKWE